MNIDAPPTIRLQSGGGLQLNYNYGYHPKGAEGIWCDGLAKGNYKLAGGWRHVFTVENATFSMGQDEINRANPLLSEFKVRRKAIAVRLRSMWCAILGSTRPIRHKLGLRKGFIAKAVAKGTRPIV